MKIYVSMYGNSVLITAQYSANKSYLWALLRCPALSRKKMRLQKTKRKLHDSREIRPALIITEVMFHSRQDFSLFRQGY